MNTYSEYVVLRDSTDAINELAFFLEKEIDVPYHALFLELGNVLSSFVNRFRKPSAQPVTPPNTSLSSFNNNDLQRYSNNTQYANDIFNALRSSVQHTMMNLHNKYHGDTNPKVSNFLNKIDDRLNELLRKLFNSTTVNIGGQRLKSIPTYYSDTNSLPTPKSRYA